MIGKSNKKRRNNMKVKESEYLKIKTPVLQKLLKYRFFKFKIIAFLYFHLMYFLSIVLLIHFIF